MRKSRNQRLIVILALFMIFCMGNLYAYKSEVKNPLWKSYHKKLVIQGGYGSVGAINITAIPAQSEQYKIGMPFSLKDPSTYFGKSEKGRLIANWNLLANGPFKIDVDAEILHNYKENNVTSGAYNDGLGYILLFVYNLSYYTGGNVYYIQNGNFKVNVPDSTTNTKVEISDIDILNGITLDNGSLVGSADGDIYFMFDQSTTGLLDSASYNSLPDGNYTAKVVLTFKVL